MIRWATVEDAGAIGQIHVGTWRAAYAGIVPESVLANLPPSARAEGWRRGLTATPPGILLAEEGGEVTGFLAFGPGRDGGPAGEAEISAL